MTKILRPIASFKERVYGMVRDIPKGSVMTYGEVAARAGKPGAARAVGNLMARNSDRNVPCHRVIRSDGKIGEYNGLRGSDKAAILAREGYKAARSTRGQRGEN